MPAGAYLKPPITEAILEFKFRDIVSEADLQKTSKRLKKSFPHVEDQIKFGFRLDARASGSASAAASRTLQGFKQSNHDQTDVVVIQRDALVISRHAPYNGWKKFKERAVSTWELCHQVFGYKTVNRIGMRYINRLDIPLDVAVGVKPHEWLNVGMGQNIPDLFPNHVTGYLLQAAFPVDENISASIRTGVLEPALIGHAAFLLDIDVFVAESSVPQNPERVWEVCEALHEHKNQIFERCITQKSRDLFDAI